MKTPDTIAEVDEMIPTLPEWVQKLCRKNPIDRWTIVAGYLSGDTEEQIQDLLDWF